MRIYNPNIARMLARPGLETLAKPSPDVQEDLKLQKLKKACRDFEAIFISYMLKAMNKTTENSDLFGSGLGGDIYKEIFNEKLAEHLSQTGQFKIGDIIYQKYANILNHEKPEISNIEINKAAAAPVNVSDEISVVNPEPDRTRVEITRPGNGGKSAVTALEAGKTGEFLSEYKDTIDKAARQFGVKASLIKAVIKHESAGDPKAVSQKGAKGLMQLIDSTAAMLDVKDPFDPAQNIMGGAKYLSVLIKKFSGDLKKALASYNAGPSAVEKHGGVPPFPETIRYVENVLSSMSSE